MRLGPWRYVRTAILAFTLGNLAPTADGQDVAVRSDFATYAWQLEVSPTSSFGSYFEGYTLGKAVPAKVEGTLDVAVADDLTVLRWRIGNETIQTNCITPTDVKVLDNRTRTWRIWGPDSARTIPWIFQFPRNLGPLAPWDDNGSMREDWTMFNRRMRFAKCSDEDREALCVTLLGKTYPRVQFGHLVDEVWPSSIEADDSGVGETARMALVLRGHSVWTPENPDRAMKAGDMAYLYGKSDTLSTTLNPKLGGLGAQFARERRVWGRVDSTQTNRDRQQLTRNAVLIAGSVFLLVAALWISGFRFRRGPKQSPNPLG